jgi:hypothetical protein
MNSAELHGKGLIETIVALPNFYDRLNGFPFKEKAPMKAGILSPLL